MEGGEQKVKDDNLGGKTALQELDPGPMVNFSFVLTDVLWCYL